MRNFAVFIILTVLVTACGKSPQFGLSPETETFAQRYQYNNKVDILWVVDSSQTMASHQQTLAQQFPSFIDVLIQKGMDFRLAVTTMDMSSGGERGAFVGSTKVLGLNTPNLKNLFSSNIQVGNQGSSLERGLESMKAALSPAMLAGANAGFLRSDAVLVVIFVTDEDDHSSGTTTSYVDFMNQLKPSFQYGAKGWFANFIGFLNPSGSCQATGTPTDPGDRYLDLVTASYGLNESICSGALASALGNIRERIAEMVTEYRLGREPIESTIQVVIDGNVIAKDSINGWTYHPENYSIHFHGAAIPAANQDVRITYQPTNPI